MKKCYADEPLVMPLEGIHVDDKLQFVEEPVEIMEREIKRLKRSRIPLVKVRWNSRRGPEFTWEREDSFKQKYPQLFTNRASSSTTRSIRHGVLRYIGGHSLERVNKENAPRTVKDIKIISAGKILENNKTVGECRNALCDVPGGVTTMHVVVSQPPQEKGASKFVILCH
ncbi:putative reverse transcriptase domain-containing protein [Tanacetum coccineum]